MLIEVDELLNLILFGWEVFIALFFLKGRRTKLLDGSKIWLSRPLFSLRARSLSGWKKDRPLLAMTRWQQGDKGNKIITAAGWHPGEPGEQLLSMTSFIFCWMRGAKDVFQCFYWSRYREVIIRGDEVEQFEDL